MLLHTVNALPTDSTFEDFLALLNPGDTVLLYGNGVYCAIAGTPGRERLDAGGANVRVLRDDAAAAGLAGKLDPEELVDMHGFVELTEQAAQQMAWY